jgi:hypothetical protein
MATLTPINSELLIMTRVLINDIDAIDFTDVRLSQTIATAALFVAQEIDLAQSYTINVSPSGLIGPDPLNTNTPDAKAVVLFPLKAACLIDQNRLQGATKNAIRIRDGDSEIDLSVGFKGFSDILKLGACQSYKLLKHDIETSDAFIGEAVLTPFRHEDVTIGVRDVFNRLAFRLNNTVG